MTDVSDTDILATALLTIKQHGENTAYYAASRADHLQEKGAHTSALTWRRILKEIERLQALPPESPSRH